MKEKLLLVVLLFATSLTTQNIFAQVPQRAELATQNVVIAKTDNRVVAVENIFKKYNSPLIGQGRHYVYYADKYGVDWRLLPSIAGLESTFGKRLMPGSHNAYGWGGGHIYFASWEDGINTINKSLSERYYGRGATTVWSIGPIYAESPTWAVRVNSFMSQIEREYVRLNAEELPLTI